MTRLLEPPNFSVIVAMDGAQGIGIANALPWRLPEDMAFFKQTTMSDAATDRPNAVIMGRLTYESLPVAFRPLPQRHNIVLTRNPTYAVPDTVITADTIDAAVTWATQHRCPHVFVIGGAQIYSAALAHPRCKSLLITEVDGLLDCDAFFPDFRSAFHRQFASEWKNSQTGIRFRFTEWVRLTPENSLSHQLE